MEAFKKVILERPARDFRPPNCSRSRTASGLQLLWIIGSRWLKIWMHLLALKPNTTIRITGCTVGKVSDYQLGRTWKGSLGYCSFSNHGIEGVVPLEILPADVRSKYQVKPNERSKRAKKDEVKSGSQQVEETQISESLMHHPDFYSWQESQIMMGEDGEANAAPVDTDTLA
ncbi:hypothetical protein MLD38_002738 [Melastoma candidum]|uniref:Uncharacterized protein n=1 Tax=Melastoma candidum TaxID=119954 RepID=A0ACB9S027_9MYRT|nr:hypothetical protein MLD38_002738 [Melastoma candidum]